MSKKGLIINLFCLISFGFIASISLQANTVNNSIYSVESYKNIIDIHCTPSSNSFYGGFSDMGSWMCFTLPNESKWVNGFCGPMDLDVRAWISDALLQVGFTKNIKTEKFTPNESVYYPGELRISSTSINGKIDQRLFFVDKYTALFSCQSDADRDLYITIGDLRNVRNYKIENNVCIIQSHQAENYRITFQEGITLTQTNNIMQVVIPKGTIGYATISFLYDVDTEATEKLTQSFKHIVNNPAAYIKAHEERWTKYLKDVLRPEMAEPYHRIAVKSMVTLLTNWRAARKALLHDGVVPSHAVGYFIGFWGWDSWKHAVALSLFEPELAKNQVRAMFDYQTEEGMIIDCIYTNAAENNYRNSKPPLAAWAVEAIYNATGDVEFVKEMYPKLLKYHQWWYKYRDNDGNGFCEFGSVDGTLEAAAWESGMDNAIRFDYTRMVKNSEGAYSANQESVDLNAYLAQDYLSLSVLAEVAGESFTEPNRIPMIADYFFDNDKGFFYDRKLGYNQFITVEGCEAYIPFWAGIATQFQADRAYNYFSNPKKFGTYIPFPTVTADHPRFSPDGYWRGPIWLDQVYFGIHGLRNYGYHYLADKYTKNVFDRLSGLREDAPIHENYETNTGKRLKAPFFSWSAAHLLMLYRESGIIDGVRTDLGNFQRSWRNFAYIKRVDFATLHHAVEYTDALVQDFSEDFCATLAPGKTYDLKVIASNYDSGWTDKYKVRVWIDWNGNFELEKDELIGTQTIDEIGKWDVENKVTFKVTVPDNAVLDKKLKFRVFLHFVQNETDGEDPYGWVDSGIAHDYAYAVSTGAASINQVEQETQFITSTVVDDYIYFTQNTQISAYQLTKLDGSIVCSSNEAVSKINVSNLEAGIYVLQVKSVSNGQPKLSHSKIVKL